MDLSGPASSARDILRAVCTALVANPSEFDVLTVMHGKTATIFAIRAAAEDRGQLIGRDGRMFTALQKIAAAAGDIDAHQVSLSEVLAPARVALPRRRSNPPFNPSWPKQSALLLAGAICSAVFKERVETELLEGGRTACLRIKGAKMFSHRRAEDLMSAVRTVFHAIGIAHGCKLVVDFSPTESE